MHDNPRSLPIIERLSYAFRDLPDMAQRAYGDLGDPGLITYMIDAWHGALIDRFCIE